MSLRGGALAALLALAGAPAAAQVGADVEARLAAADWAGAEALLRARLAQAPGDDAARFQLARVLAWQERPGEALPLYAALLAREPRNADYLFGHAQAQLWSGDRVAADASLARLETLAPDHPGLDTLRRQLAAAPADGPGASRPAGPATLVDGGAPAKPSVREIGFAVRHEWLTRGLDPWHGDRLDVAGRRADGQAWHVALARERRFGLVDSGLEAGVAIPLDARWSLQLEGGAWPGADFQPRWFGEARLQHAFEGGTVLAAGLRRTRYPAVTVDRLALALEHYVGDWRLGYTFNRIDVGGSRVNGHDAALDRYYGDRDYIGLRLTTGREDALQGTRVISAPVRAVALQGRHGWSADWALQWAVGYVRQGELHDRRWLQLGLRRSF